MDEATPHWHIGEMYEDRPIMLLARSVARLAHWLNWIGCQRAAVWTMERAKDLRAHGIVCELIPDNEPARIKAAERGHPPQLNWPGRYRLILADEGSEADE